MEASVATEQILAGFAFKVQCSPRARYRRRLQVQQRTAAHKHRPEVPFCTTLHQLGLLSSQTPNLTALLRLFTPFFHKNIAVFPPFPTTTLPPQPTSSPPPGPIFLRAQKSRTHRLGQMLLLPDHAERVSSLALPRRYAPLSEFNRRASYTRESPPSTARGVCSLVRPG